MKILQKFRYKETIQPLSYSFYYVPVVIIALIGLFDSVYLSISHYRNYMDMGYQSFCAISRAINCDTVSQSPYSVFMNVPVPVWGIWGYSFYLFLLAFSWSIAANRKRVWTLLMLLSLIFSAYSVILAFISSYYINSYCIMCILSYAVNLALLFYVWIIRNRFLCESLFVAIKMDLLYLIRLPKISIPGASFFIVSIIVMMFNFPQYWHMNPPKLSENIAKGITAEGYPWIGAENPELVITEFTDYRCFQCKKMHYFLRRIIDNNPDKIRLVHRHFPMDHTINPIVKEPFHHGAAKLAIISIFAEEKGKFWEMNDLLFDISGQTEAVNLHFFANASGIAFEEIRYIFRNNDLWMRLRKDIADGIKYELNGTPGFIICDSVYQAQIPSEILKPYLK